MDRFSPGRLGPRMLYAGGVLPERSHPTAGAAAELFAGRGRDGRLRAELRRKGAALPPTSWPPVIRGRATATRRAVARATAQAAHQHFTLQGGMQFKASCPYHGALRPANKNVGIRSAVVTRGPKPQWE
jgi:hypothetical protein